MPTLQDNKSQLTLPGDPINPSPGKYITNNLAINSAWDYEELKIRQDRDKYMRIRHDANRTIETFNAFCCTKPEHTNPLMNDVILLSSLGDNLYPARNIRRKNSMAALGCYATCALQLTKLGVKVGRSKPELRYVMGLLRDRGTIDDFFQNKLRKAYHNRAAMDYLERSKSPTTVTDSRIWKGDESKTYFISPEEMYSELAANINLESILLMSAQVVSQTNHDNKHSDYSSDTLRRAIMAESLLAPLCSFMGYHNLEQALINESSIARFVNGTREMKEFSKTAFELYKAYGGHEEIEGKVGELNDLIFGRTSIYELSTKYDKIHHTLAGVGLADLSEFDIQQESRFVWRRKSLGSFMKKMYKYKADGKEGALPMDFIGMTIITNSDEETGQVVKHLIEQLQNCPDAEFKPSSSRDFPVHIKGSDAFRQEITGQIYKAGYHISNIDQKSGEFQHTKITFMYKGLPCEIQIMTEDIREQAIIGQISHFDYKMRDEGTVATDEDNEAKASIKERKKSIGSIALNPVCIAPAQKMLDETIKIYALAA